MSPNPISFDFGGDRFVWCVDDEGVIRAVPTMLFKDLEPAVAMRRWRWRYATENEVVEHRRLHRRA